MVKRQKMIQSVSIGFVLIPSFVSVLKNQTKFKMKVEIHLFQLFPHTKKKNYSEAQAPFFPRRVCCGFD